MNFNERNEIFLEKYKPNKINTIERLRCLNALFMKSYYEKIPIIATSIQSLSTKTIPFDLFTELSFKLEIGMKKTLEEAVNNLINKNNLIKMKPNAFIINTSISLLLQTSSNGEFLSSFILAPVK